MVLNYFKKTDTILFSRHNANFFSLSHAHHILINSFHICFTELNIYRLSFFHYTVQNQHC